MNLIISLKLMMANTTKVIGKKIILIIFTKQFMLSSNDSLYLEIDVLSKENMNIIIKDAAAIARKLVTIGIKSRRKISV